MFCLIDYYQLTTSVPRKKQKRDNTIDTIAMRKNQKKATELREFVSNTSNHFKLLDESRKKQEKDKEFVDFVKEHYKLK